MKCANCGNTNQSTLFDEEQTIYCSICQHRTDKKNGRDNSVMCPVCHDLRDPKAVYCRWCNDSSWGKYDPIAKQMNEEYKKKYGNR